MSEDAREALERLWNKLPQAEHHAGTFWYEAGTIDGLIQKAIKAVEVPDKQKVEDR